VDKTVTDLWAHGDPYELYVGRWSRQVAPLFLRWLQAPAGLRWLDLGCGTGALATAILDGCSPASVVGVEPSEGFLQKAKERLGTRMHLLTGNAAEIPLEAASVDMCVSALVLNFVPEPARALAEMRRVTAPAGTIAGYVWDYAGQMQLMRHFWDAARQLDPAAAPLDEGLRFPLCRPQALGALFSEAGLTGVRTEAIEIPTLFRDFDDYWRPFLGGQGPAPAYLMSLSEPHREAVRELLQERLAPAAGQAIELVARSWAVRGTVP
jgi:SAM-dependent methyltransferase